jgi:hypothetical protein
MSLLREQNEAAYRDAMGRLLVLYTQVDSLIMRACAERIAAAPDEVARLGLAKQVGDEARHVAIQQEWMREFGVAPAPVLGAQQEAEILTHFRALDWLEFLTDMYLCVEALGSDAVESIVPLADPGTRQSLHVPLQDELDHIRFGVERLRAELSRLSPAERRTFLGSIPGRITALGEAFHAMGLDLRRLFEAVGADYEALCRSVLERKEEVLREVAEPLAA